MEHIKKNRKKLEKKLDKNREFGENEKQLKNKKSLNTKT